MSERRPPANGKGAYVSRGLNRAEVPKRGEIVELGGLEGRVVKVTPCYAGIWVQFNGSHEVTLYTWRRYLQAWRAFPERVAEPNLTLD